MFIVVICMSWKLEICSPPDKGDVRIFLPTLYFDRCVGALGGLSLVGGEQRCICSLREGSVVADLLLGGGISPPVHV